jgi:hypothetical protein
LRDGSGGGEINRGKGGGINVAAATRGIAASAGASTVNACSQRWQRTERPRIAGEYANDAAQPGHGIRAVIDELNRDEGDLPQL